MKVMVLVESLHKLQKIFWQELTDILNDQSVQVRISWPQNGSPDWDISEDVIFIQVTEDNGEDITRYMDNRLEDKKEDLLLRQAMTRVIKLTLTAYGPRSHSLLSCIRHRLMQGRYSLQKQKLFVIPEPSTLKFVPELFQTRWWGRSDLTIKFNSLIMFDTDINAIKEVNVTLRPINDKLNIKKHKKRLAFSPVKSD